MNLALFEVSTRGGVNQPLACPGVRAHRDPGALGGHRCVLPMSIVIGGPVRNALNIWWVAVMGCCDSCADFGAMEAHSSSCDCDPSTSLRSA